MMEHILRRDDDDKRRGKVRKTEWTKHDDVQNHPSLFDVSFTSSLCMLFKFVKKKSESDVAIFALGIQKEPTRREGGAGDSTFFHDWSSVTLFRWWSHWWSYISLKGVYLLPLLLHQEEVVLEYIKELGDKKNDLLKSDLQTLVIIFF